MSKQNKHLCMPCDTPFTAPRSPGSVHTALTYGIEEGTQMTPAAILGLPWRDERELALLGAYGEEEKGRRRFVTASQ